MLYFNSFPDGRNFISSFEYEGANIYPIENYDPFAIYFVDDGILHETRKYLREEDTENPNTKVEKLVTEIVNNT